MDIAMSRSISTRRSALPQSLYNESTFHMKRYWSLLLPAILLAALLPAHAVQLKIITKNGTVSFAPPDHWIVLSMQTKLPVARVVFQLPNIADEQTEHSTNLVLNLYDKLADQGKSAYASVPTVPGGSNRKEWTWERWTMVRHDAQQGGVPYTIIDARRPDVGGVAASVRFAWPHLKRNAASYDADVQQSLRIFLLSVEGSEEPYVRSEQDKIYRRVP